MKSFLNRFSIKRLIPGLVAISLLVLAAVIIPLPLPAEAGWAGDDFNLTVNVRTGGGRIAVDLQEQPSLPFTESYAEGAVIIIEAIPSFGYVFNGWEGHISSKENPEYIIMDCNKQVTAGFSVDWRLIGTLIGSFILLILFAAVLFTRRNAPENAPPIKNERTIEE